MRGKNVDQTIFDIALWQDLLNFVWQINKFDLAPRGKGPSLGIDLQSFLTLCVPEKRALCLEISSSRHSSLMLLYTNLRKSKKAISAKWESYEAKEQQIMSKQAKQEAQGLLKAIAILLRNTTWKCGRVERLVVNYLQTQLQARGRTQTPVKDMLQHFRFSGKQKNEFLDALKRLEKRHIIQIEAF